MLEACVRNGAPWPGTQNNAGGRMNKRRRSIAPKGPATDAAAQVAERRGFARTEVWIFDLDNTLYPSACDLFSQVDHRMGEFIARYLGVPYAHARNLQKTYYRQFGTTLSGLMKVHNLEPKAFLDYVHDIDLSVLPESPELAAALSRLPGRRLIFTNGSRTHAERVAGKLGILHLFEDICDIAACSYVPKPQREAFDGLVHRHSIDPAAAAMFEDMPLNLEAPHALGMTTVLVRSEARDHPSLVALDRLPQPPAHIHHTTDDLTAFLTTALPAKA
jgi:putative hydrolase of the HAD superfamily